MVLDIEVRSIGVSLRTAGIVQKKRASSNKRKFRLDLILCTLLSPLKCQVPEYADQGMKVLIYIMSLSPAD